MAIDDDDDDNDDGNDDGGQVKTGKSSLPIEPCTPDRERENKDSTYHNS